MDVLPLCVTFIMLLMETHEEVQTGQAASAVLSGRDGNNQVIPFAWANYTRRVLTLG